LPKILAPDPILTAFRRESEEPAKTKFKTENPDPNLEVDLRLIAEPRLAKSRSDI
jgi:hypothetical protein